MKKDKLKLFIDQNRSEFDSEKAPEHIWNNISAGLNKKATIQQSTKTPVWYFLSGIAATLLLLVVALAGYQIGKSESSFLSKSDSFTQYTAQEKIYQEEISNKINMLEVNTLDRSIQNDLVELDAVYQELKAELLENQNGNTDLIIDALIKNYKTKIEILELILEKQLEGKKEEEDEGFKI